MRERLPDALVAALNEAGVTFIKAATSALDAA